MTASATWTDWSCTVRVAVSDPSRLDRAVHHLRALMREVEKAASRFRPDSELSQCNERAGLINTVSPLFMDLMTTALEAAAQTGGAVDPTVGTHLLAAGYDRDISEVRAGPGALTPIGPAPQRLPDWRAVRVDQALGLVGVPENLALDLGATAKAWTADRGAQEIHAMLGGRVLVELGGDLAVAGATDEPFPIRVAEREGQAGQLVDVAHGGLATSTTEVRRWSYAGREQHHIIDPRTGAPVRSLWRTATVWAPTAVNANTASTAAIVMSDRAIAWLGENAPRARLVDLDGEVRELAGWPTWQCAA